MYLSFLTGLFRLLAARKKPTKVFMLSMLQSMSFVSVMIGGRQCVRKDDKQGRLLGRGWLPKLP